MVPLALLIVLPLVAAAGHEGGHDMKDMMQMMEMMEMMNKMKGWGDNYAEKEDSKEETAMSVQSAEDYEAYLKWCEENRARQAEFQQQQKLLDEFKAREAAKAEEARKMRVKQEAEERQHNMMAEWRNWERQMQNVASFDKLGSELMEMKGQYYYKVTFSFLKFCKCTDFAGEIESFFMGGKEAGEEYDLDLLDDIVEVEAGSDPAVVAQTLVNLSKGDQIKAFFGGLKESMCDGAEAYFEQVEAWEKQYNFLERLH